MRPSVQVFDAAAAAAVAERVEIVVVVMAVADEEYSVSGDCDVPSGLGC